MKQKRQIVLRVIVGPRLSASVTRLFSSSFFLFLSRDTEERMELGDNLSGDVIKVDSLSLFSAIYININKI